ncbi:MAG: hypothetical protein M1829_002308 [Trizodia sp. TS-e1964]|nr:MAG: hypothetical protein M1829_002308 [Trizodia sp. TS-e1964]
MRFTSTNSVSSALFALILAVSAVSSLAILPDALSSSNTYTPSVGIKWKAVSQLRPRETGFNPFYPWDTTMEAASKMMAGLNRGSSLRYQFNEITIQLPDPNEDQSPALRRVFAVYCWKVDRDRPENVDRLLNWPPIDDDFKKDSPSLVIMAAYDRIGKEWKTFTGYMQDMKERLDLGIQESLDFSQNPVRVEKLIRETLPVAEKGQSDFEITKAWAKRAKANLLQVGALIRSY